MKRKFILAPCLFLSLAAATRAQQAAIPSVLHNVSYDASGKIKVAKANLLEMDKPDPYVLSKMIGSPVGTATGIALDIQNSAFNGSVSYGPLNETAKHPTIAFLPKDVKMVAGKAVIELKDVLVKSNDFFKFETAAKGVIGYRIADQNGRIIYEGRVAFEGNGPYKVVPTIIEGPMVHNVASDSAVIAYETMKPEMTELEVNGQSYKDGAASTHHEFTVKGLAAAKEYDYSVRYGARSAKGSFKTAPEAGSRKKFSFGFASANRATTGGGARDFGGVNYESTKEIMALAAKTGVAFMQIQGDLTTGGNTSEDGHLMEYANLKRAIEPFGQFPSYYGFGDHEPNKVIFTPDPTTGKSKSIEAFPYATTSGEATFAKAFVNPANGPISEDGASYDPNPNQLDFPTYKENVYYYTYDNVAMIVLNTEYWESKDPALTSGCPEGYIMDQQVKWLKQTMGKMEADKAIDHIFVVVHGTAFPNGDHLPDAMWWNGSNDMRAVVAGKPLSKGTIERRDEILDICVNHSEKFLAFISGDEHNFSFLQVDDKMPRYLPSYEGKKVALKKPFYVINNGAGGSASYALIKSPWSDRFQHLTEPPVLAVITVEGEHVKLKAVKADTFEKLCDIKLK